MDQIRNLKVLFLLQTHKNIPQLNVYFNEEISNFTQNKNINIKLNNYKNIKDLEIIRENYLFLIISQKNKKRIYFKI